MRAKPEAAKGSGKVVLSTQLVMGPDFQQKLQNAAAGVERGLIAPVELICRAA